MRKYTPKVGDRVRYELAPDALVQPRWNYSLDHGASGRFAEAPVTDVFEDHAFEISFPGGTIWCFHMPDHHNFQPGRPGWPVVIEAR